MLLALVVVLLALLVTARVLLPGWLIDLVERHGSAALVSGRLGVEDVDLSLLHGQLTLHGVAITPEGAAEPLLAAERLSADLSWWPLIGWRAHLEEVHLERLQVSLELDETGSLTLLSFLARGESEEDSGPVPVEPAPVEPAPGDVADSADGGRPFVVQVDRVVVAETDLEFRDTRSEPLPPARGRLGEFALRGLSLELPGGGAPLAWSFDGVEASSWHGRLGAEEQRELQLTLRGGVERFTPGGAPSPFHFAVQGPVGKVELRGETRLAPLYLDAELSWEGVHLENYWLPFDHMSPGNVAKASSEGSLALRLGGEESGPLVLSVAGNAALRDAELTIALGTSNKVSWQSVEVDLAELRWPLEAAGEEALAPPSIHLARVGITSPQIEWKRPPPGDADAVAKKEAAAEEGAAAEEEAAVQEEAGAQTAEPAEPLRVLVDTFEIRDGRVAIEDETVEGGFRYTITDFDVTSQSIRLPEMECAALELAAGPDEARELRLEGRRGADDGDAKVVLDGLSLLPFNPYIREFANYTVSRGALDVEMEGKRVGERYDADMKLRFAGLQVAQAGAGGKASGFERAFGVPLNVALSLLRNRRGDVVLNAPFEGNTEGGRVPIGRAVVSATRRSLVNALAKPLSLVAGVLIPAGPDSEMTVSLLPFSPGDAGLSQYGLDRLDNASASLARNPELYVYLFVRVSGADVTAVAESAGLSSDGEGKLEEGSELQQAVAILASQRLSGVSQRLRAEYGLSQERITLLEWDGDVEGAPGGVQLGLSQGKVPIGPLRGIRRLIPGI